MVGLSVDVLGVAKVDSWEEDSWEEVIRVVKEVSVEEEH
jgi:hypothetical protein